LRAFPALEVCDDVAPLCFHVAVTDFGRFTAFCSCFDILSRAA